MHRLQVPVGMHQMLQRDPFADRELCYSRYSTRGTHLVMGRGTSLATTENHCSESWGLWGTGAGQLSDGRTLLGAAPGSRIEVDEVNVDLQMALRWVAIGRSGIWETGKQGNREVEGEQLGSDRPS